MLEIKKKSIISGSLSPAKPGDLPALYQQSKLNEKRVEQIKKSVARGYDNLSKPVPLMYQLVKENS